MHTLEAFLSFNHTIRDQVSQACLDVGRCPEDVQILPVTKTHGAEAVCFAAQAGYLAVGENRVQEAAQKRAQCRAKVSWELIGHLQSNKARLALETFERIQTVDRPKLLRQLASHAEELFDKPYPVLLQVNAGRDPAKFGCAVEEAPALLEAALNLPALRVEGLMTIAPMSDDPTVARQCFARLRSLRDTLQEQFAQPLPELSMGMSGDFALAIAEGATLLRLGSSLFGSRGEVARL